MVSILKKQRSFFKNIVRSDYKIFKNIVGSFCIYAVENGSITVDQLDVIRRNILFKTKKLSKVWFLVSPLQSVTKKNIGSRMGGGKGAHSHFVFKVRKGDKLIAFEKLTYPQLLRSLNLFRSSLAFKVKILYIKSF